MALSPDDYKNCFSISLAGFPGKRIFLRTYAGDIDIFYEIFFKEVYRLPRVPANALVVDAGANVGFATLFFLKQMPDAIVYCIEPDPDNFIFLQKNLESEIETGKVKPVMTALSNIKGPMNLYMNRLKYNSTLAKIPSQHSVEVPAHTVETFLEKYIFTRVTLFKMDIEGAEEGIFENDLSWLENVDEILIEFHSEKIQQLCFEKMQSNNFYFEPESKRSNTNVFLFRRGEKGTATK